MRQSEEGGYYDNMWTNNLVDLNTRQTNREAINRPAILTKHKLISLITETQSKHKERN